jgi:hypothetical protein
MEVIRISSIVLLLLFSFFGNAQELNTRKHLVGATSTISPGFQKNNPDVNIYLHGLAYFYPEPKVSINGEIYWYTGAQEQRTLMAENSSLIFGMNYHFAKDGKFDPFVGIMPGLSLVSAINYNIQRPTASKISVVPIMTFNAGMKFHMAKWCNVFMNIRYVKGTLVENYYQSLPLDELRVSFGLGFNFYGKEFYNKN